MNSMKNVPNWERALRVLAGLGGVALGLLALDGTAGLLVAASGAGLAGTGLMGFCPACALAGRRLGKAGDGAR